MRRIVSALLVLVLNLSPTTAMAGADDSHMSLSPPTAIPGTEVTVEIQLDRPPVDGTTYGMGFERAIDGPESFTVTESAPPPDDEEVVFRVTLEGQVDPSHTFGVRRQCPDTCATEAIVILCTPPNDIYDYPTCSPATFEFTSEIRAGATVEYALLRWKTLRDEPEEHLADSWVVQEGRQVLSLGYVYPGAGTESPRSRAPALPDTAVPAP